MIEIPDIDFENVCLSDGGESGRDSEEIKPDDEMIEIPDIDFDNVSLTDGGESGRDNEEIEILAPDDGHEVDGNVATTLANISQSFSFRCAR